MEKIRMGIGFGGWRLGTPSAATMFELIDKAEPWGIDSIWLSDHLLDSGAHAELDTPKCCEKIARYIEAGLTKFVLWPACPPADLIEQVDRFAHQLMPEFSAV